MQSITMTHLQDFIMNIKYQHEECNFRKDNFLIDFTS